jgi:hypothetical protein
MGAMVWTYRSVFVAMLTTHTVMTDNGKSNETNTTNTQAVIDRVRDNRRRLGAAGAVGVNSSDVTSAQFQGTHAWFLRTGEVS